MKAPEAMASLKRTEKKGSKKKAGAELQYKDVATICTIYITRSLGALRAPTSSWRPCGPLDFVLHALRALRPCDPRVGDWIVC